MTPFSYAAPESLEAAFGVLRQGSKVIAGGQSLLLALKDRQARPEGLVAVSALAELRGFETLPDGGLSIGAATRYVELAKAAFPGWHGAINTVAAGLADRSVRSLGTLGGALVQADPRFDMPAFCVAVDARLVLQSSKGLREVAAAEFYDPATGSRIAPDEILLRVLFKPASAWSAVAFEKFTFRTFEAAIVNIGGAVKLDGTGRIEKLRITAGAIAKTPVTAARSTAGCIGREISALDVEAVAEEISLELLPPDSLMTRQQKYQAELVISLSKRLLRSLRAGVAS